MGEFEEGVNQAHTGNRNSGHGHDEQDEKKQRGRIGLATVRVDHQRNSNYRIYPKALGQEGGKR